MNHHGREQGVDVSLRGCMCNSCPIHGVVDRLPLDRHCATCAFSDSTAELPVGVPSPLEPLLVPPSTSINNHHHTITTPTNKTRNSQTLEGGGRHSPNKAKHARQNTFSYIYQTRAHTRTHNNNRRLESVSLRCHVVSLLVLVLVAGAIGAGI